MNQATEAYNQYLEEWRKNNPRPNHKKEENMDFIKKVKSEGRPLVDNPIYSKSQHERYGYCLTGVYKMGNEQVIEILRRKSGAALRRACIFENKKHWEEYTVPMNESAYFGRW